MTDHTGPVIRLEGIAGPPIEPIVLDGEDVFLFGRSSACERQLNDTTVSRRHCRVTCRGGSWFIADLDSRHGTYLNGVRLDPEQPAPLSDGDLIRVGPWTFRLRDGSDHTSSMPTTNDLATTSHRVQRVPVRELRSIAEQRLDLLVDCAAAINAAADVHELADRVLDAVCHGTGFVRAAFIRQVSAQGDVEVIAVRGVRETEHGPDRGFSFSRSLITAAAEGEIVRIQGDAGVNFGESIVRLGITAALCAPVMLGGTPEAYLYLDARGSTSSIQTDAAAFCQAVSRMAGLALGNIKRVELEKAQARIASDLSGAREAQRMIMPGSAGRVGAFAYALVARPGRHVAGDLFDIMPVGDAQHEPATPVGVFIGDVSGKGAAAGILMATAQTFLRLALKAGKDPAAAVAEANGYLAERIEDRAFISLCLGVLDPRDHTFTFVDAGHGHWLVVPPHGPPAPVPCRGGLLLAVRRDAAYAAETTPFPPGSRLVLFSDGVVEQPDPDGVQFGARRVIDAVAGSTSAQGDITAITAAVRAHAQTDAIADDLTVASVEFLLA